MRRSYIILKYSHVCLNLSISNKKKYITYTRTESQDGQFSRTLMICVDCATLSETLISLLQCSCWKRLLQSDRASRGLCRNNTLVLSCQPKTVTPLKETQVQYYFQITQEKTQYYWLLATKREEKQDNNNKRKFLLKMFPNQTAAQKMSWQGRMGNHSFPKFQFLLLIISGTVRM